MSVVGTDEKDPFSFLTISSTLKWFKTVTGSRSTSCDCFVMTWPIALVGGTFCARWPSLRHNSKRVGGWSLICLTENQLKNLSVSFL